MASSMPKAAASLTVRKQDFVRREFWTAAIDLFARKGFEATTIDEIAAAARVSRRTFFRYFSSKEDLLVQAMGPFEEMLVEAVQEFAPLAANSVAMLQKIVLRVTGRIILEPLARKSMDVSQRSAAVRGAQLARLYEIQGRLAAEFSSRCKGLGKDRYTPRLLASLTLSMIDIALLMWLEAGPDQIPVIVERLCLSLRKVGAAG